MKHTYNYTEIHRSSEKHTDTQTYTQTHRNSEAHTHTQIHRNTHTHTQTHRKTHTNINGMKKISYTEGQTFKISEEKKKGDVGREKKMMWGGGRRG